LKEYFKKKANEHLFENKGLLKDINNILENLHNN